MAVASERQLSDKQRKATITAVQQPGVAAVSARLPASWQAIGRAIQRNRLSWVGLALLAGFLLVALSAPWLAPYDPQERVARPFMPPNQEHWLGTNDIGQDILSELIYGTRLSLFFGIGAALLSVALSAAVGLVAGYSGGLVDSLLMRLVDLALAFPFLPLMIVLAAYLGPGLLTELLVISVLLWAGPARIIRAQVLVTNTLPYVEGARAIGAQSGRILWYYLLPAVVPLLIAQFIRAVNVSIVAEASLSFLGLGDPTQKSWGTILYYANARGAYLTNAWLWWVVPPGLCIAGAVLGFALTGLALEEAADPRLRRPS